jgi:antitoxin (DNA-binding transcriptional repressor) of toxin-antitoxin stability system
VVVAEVAGLGLEPNRWEWYSQWQGKKKRGLAMSATVTLAEAQAKLPELIGSLEPGQEIVITEDQRPVAKLIGERKPARQRPGPGLCRAMLRIVHDDDDHLNDFAEYMP